MRCHRLLPLLLMLGAAAAHAQSYPDQVVIILDGSGSMREPMKQMRMTKMEAAKDALKTVLTQLGTTTHVGLLVFSKQTMNHPWVQEPGAVEPAKLQKAIDGVVADGATPLGQFLKLGADKLLELRAAQFGYGSYRLLVVTDGEASDAELMNEYAPEVAMRGITMDVIGVDMESQHTLSKVAHSYRSADNPDTLKEAIQATFAEVSGDGKDTAASNTDFDLLAGIPSEVATAMLEGLAAQDNTPIGDKPEPAPKPAPASATANSPAPAPAPPVAEAKKDFPWGLVIAPVILIIVLASRFRKKSGR